MDSVSAENPGDRMAPPAAASGSTDLRRPPADPADHSAMSTAAGDAPAAGVPDKLAAGSVSARAAGPGFSEHPEDGWMPLHDLPWHRRWRQGWRLAVVLTAVPLVYLIWRGAEDYQSLKQWRAMGWLAAMEKADSMDSKRDYLQKAGILAPGHEPVIRAVADFCEKAGDGGTALLAFQQLRRIRRESPADEIRRLRLALALGRLDEETRGVLGSWSKEEAGSLEAEKVVLSCRWLGQQGRMAEAINRLGAKIDVEPPGETKAMLQLVKCQMLLQSGPAAIPGVAPQEAWSILAELMRPSNAHPAVLKEEATMLLADSFSHPSRWGALLLEDTAAGFVNVLSEVLDEGGLAPGPGFRVDLSRTALRIRLTPLDGEEEIRALCARWREGPEDCRLALLRWLNTEGHFDAAVAWAGRAAPQPDSRDWRVSRLDALFGDQAWVQLEALLQEGADQPLSGLMRRLFLYRLATAKGNASVQGEREALLREAPTADSHEVLFAAGNLEQVRDLDSALVLFRQLKDRDGVAAAARQGIVRCLNSFPDRVNELIASLESLLNQEPDLTEAKGDLAYLRLMEGSPKPEDFETLQSLARDFPQYLSYRSGAALAYLKQGLPAMAIKAYEGAGVDWENVPVSWRLVRAAVLVAAGHRDQALPLVSGIDPARLRPGERMLLKKQVLLEAL